MHARLAVIAAVSVAAGLVAPDAGWLGIQAAEQPAVEVPSRALLDQYCVTCHNDRLQTAELSLDGVDLSLIHI